MKTGNLPGLSAGMVVLVVSLLTTALAGVAWAAATGHEAGTNIQLKDFLYRVINFLILCGIVLYFTIRPLRNRLYRRRVELQENLEQAKRALSQAEARLSDFEATLAQRDREMLDMRRRTAEDNQKERDNALKEVTALAEKVIRDTEEMAKREINEAKRQLREEAARMAVAVAEVQLREKATPEDSLRLVHENIQRLEKQ